MLYLLPNLLHEEASVAASFPPLVNEVVLTLDGLIAESDRGARLFLRHFFSEREPMKLAFLNEHTTSQELESLVKLLVNERWGLISDSGLPILADPGAQLVALARKRGIAVEAISGPSSLFLALMLSGLPAQRFSFLGYLEREREPLISQIKRMELQSQKEKSTMLFIEAPYRNQKLLTLLIEQLSPATQLCVAVNLGAPSQFVLSQDVKKWREMTLPDIQKKEAVFVFTRLCTIFS